MAGRWFAVVALSVLFTGCSDHGDGELTLPERPDEFLLTCGQGPSFPPAALEGPADVGPHPALDALRANRKGFPLPPGEAEWRILGKTGDEVIFGFGDPAKNKLSYAVVRRKGDVWDVENSGGCKPRPVWDGLGHADWEPEMPVPAQATTFVAKVLEQACTGGASAERRIYPPDIEYRPDAVVVTFWVKPQPDGLATCPSNPVTRYEVTLKESLGGRALLNGGVYPPRPPSLQP